MKLSIIRPFGIGVFGLLALTTQLAAQTSAFTYQGSLTQNGQPANGTYDFMFRLLDAETDGTAAPVIPLNPGVGVTNGLFTTGIDFGAENLNGANLWLEISVRTNGGSAFTTLAPRQLLTSAPYAVRAANVSASGVSGTYGSAVAFNNAANSFAGSGAGLTALNATALTQGTVPPAALDNAWKIGGNAGTTTGTHFIGTTDNQPVEIKVNGMRAFRLEDNGNSSFPNHLAVDGAPNVIGGASVNLVEIGAVGATIGGGGAVHFAQSDGPAAPNTIAADFATIGGGVQNAIKTDAIRATISGGSFNTIETNAWFSTISGGTGNTIHTNASYSIIGGGSRNEIHPVATDASIGGGYFNSIQNRALFTTIGGGFGNLIEAEASYATIPGGHLNTAATYAFAAGRRAKAIHAGAFVWGDSTNADIASTDTNSVTMRASGGYRLFSDATSTSGVSLAPNATAWSVISDRAVKKDFAAVDGREVLEKLTAVPVQSWHYQWETADATPHLGPVAQDFKAAFYPGRDDKSITTLEFDGVALAAIQGLNQKLEARSQELGAELEQKQTEITELRRQNADLLRRLEAIEARLR